MKKLLIVLGVILVIMAIALIFLLPGRSADKIGLKLPTGDETSFPTETGEIGTSGTSDKQTPQAESSTFPDNNDTGAGGSVMLGKTAKLLWDKPIVSVTMFGSIKGESLTARFMEKGTGHIYDHNIVTGQSKRVSGTTIPRVQKAIWGNRGQSVFLQYPDKDGTTKNYVGRLGLATSTEGGLSGEYISGNFLYVVTGPASLESVSCPPLLKLKLEKGKSNDPSEVKRLQQFLLAQGESTVKETGIFDEETFVAVVRFQEKYRDELLTPNGLSAGNGLVGPSTRKKINDLHCEKEGQTVNGGQLAYLKEEPGKELSAGTMSFSGEPGVKLFTTSVGELGILWSNPKTAFVFTQPNSRDAGTLFSIPAAKSNVSLGDISTPIVRNVKGLTVNISPGAEKVVYGSSGPSRYLNKIFDIKAGTTRQLPVTTIPSDKCVWGNDKLLYCAGPKATLGSSEPESWYLGLTETEDNIYAIDTEMDTVSTVFSPEKNAPDVKNIQISSDGSVLIFIDKRDSSLWGIYLNDL